jgi:hypothetical protein
VRMLKTLPGWVVDNKSSVAREAAPYVALSPDERAACLVQVCRTAMSIAKGRPDSARVFSFRDAVPATTEQALARLRALQSSLPRTGSAGSERTR